MKYCTFGPDGNILKTGTVPASLQSALRAAEGDNILFFGADTNIGDDSHFVDVDTKAVCAIPPRPTSAHIWDWSTKSWLPSLSRAQAAKRVEIERERDRRITSQVISYDGKNLDADAVSIDRLAKKLAALDAYEKLGEVMPVDMLFWRDADNVTHTFASHAQYKVWLAGLAVAIDVRGSQAFAWSWEKKALMDAASTVGDVLAINAGPAG